MSPASAGNLEVERYIGACLISQNRVKNKPPPPPPPQRQEQYNNNNNRDVTQDIYRKHHVNYRLQRCHSVESWNGGGMPFITFPHHHHHHHHHHHQRKEDQNSLAKLAVHTQGAPLILTKTFHHRKNKVDRNNNGKVYENSINKKNVKCQNSADAASVASDESSGSNNSETCLPRIIKPRKRRKKERKPPTLSRPLSQDSSSTDSASPDVENNRINYLSLSPFNLFNFSPYGGALMFPESSKIVDRLNDINETPKLHHSFEDIEEPDEGKDVNGNQSTSNCQCRYCDPSGQIWDVDRECYSPFLTPPLKSFKYPNLEEVSYYSSPISTDCLEHTLSSITLESDGVKKIPVTSSSRDLEVSTEIVTSLNGHRDLEIKFFSTPCHVDNDAKNDNGTKKCNFENDLGLNLEE